MSIIRRIKNIAHEVSEGYLLFDRSMNEAILQKFDDGEIDNTEILKRICEHANQNVYLSKFNDGDRSNILFNIADYDLIKENIDESEQSMELYDTPPEDFRSALQMVVEGVEKTASLETEKLSGESVNEANEFRNRYASFANVVGMMKTASEAELESGFNLMYHDAKRIVANGDSLGDMAKIASRCAIEDGVNPNGVMKAYSIIEEELNGSGYNVRNDFTKTSSLKINHQSIALRPIKEMALAIEKIAALEEMKANLDNITKAFDKVILKNA